MGNKKLYNAADEGTVKDKQETLDLERQQELSDLKEILNTKPGLRFFQRFFEKGRIFDSSFTGNSHTFFNEGHRNFALLFLGDITEAAPEKLPQLLIKKGKE